MAFSLGWKETIQNSLVDADITASAWPIKGFGTLQSANVKSISLNRALPAVNEVVTTAALAAAPATPATTTFELRVHTATSRYESELANGMISHGRPYVLTVTVAASTSAANVAAAFETAYLAQIARGAARDLPPVSIADSSTSLVITAKSASISILRVEYRSTAPGTASQDFTAIFIKGGGVGTLTTAGFEGQGQGKFLEESRRMATNFNQDPYRQYINGSDAVDVRGSYAELTFSITPPITSGYGLHDSLGHDVANQLVTAKEVNFTVYLHESAFAGTTTNFALWLDAAITAATNIEVTTLNGTANANVAAFYNGFKLTAAGAEDADFAAADFIGNNLAVSAA